MDEKRYFVIKILDEEEIDILDGLYYRVCSTE